MNHRFVRLFFQAFLPPMLYNGVSFECHPQNCLARFDLKTKELRGFVVRDLEGIRFHPETLYASTGIELDCFPGSVNAAPHLNILYERTYDKAIHNLLQRLIRVLDLHYNDQGWEIVKKHLSQSVPKDHPLHNAWLSPERKKVPSKCDLRTITATMGRLVSRLFSLLASSLMFGSSMFTLQSPILSSIVNYHRTHPCGNEQ